MAKVAMQSAYALRLAHERVAELETQIEKSTKRRKVKRSYMKAAGLLATDDVEIELVEGRVEVDEDTIVNRESAIQRRCRLCNEPGHNSRTCSR